MLYTEWNWDTALEVAREEAFEDGEEKGREEGHNEVFALLDQGLSVEEIKQRLMQTTTS